MRIALCCCMRCLANNVVGDGRLGRFGGGLLGMTGGIRFERRFCDGAGPLPFDGQDFDVRMICVVVLVDDDNVL